MNNKFLKLFLIPLFFLGISCSTNGGNDSTSVLIKTTMGDIKLKLYDETPLHRDNFIQLVKSGFYEGISFHRVIKDFMIQSGDPSTKTAKEGNVSDTLKTYTIPSEINHKYFHKKGALAAARQADEINPQMRSSGTQFYIIQGVKFNDDELLTAEKRINNNIKQAVYIRILKECSDSLQRTGIPQADAKIQEVASMKMFQYLSDNKDYKIPEEQRNIYKTIGGTPRLDQTYTVFGEVTEGLDIVDRIASTATGPNDVPLNDIKILKIKILKK